MFGAESGKRAGTRKGQGRGKGKDVDSDSKVLGDRMDLLAFK